MELGKHDKDSLTGKNSQLFNKLMNLFIIHRYFSFCCMISHLQNSLRIIKVVFGEYFRESYQGMRRISYSPLYSSMHINRIIYDFLNI